MSWWDEKIGRTGVVIGDEPLDAIAEAFTIVAKLYQKEMGRKPTAAELARLVDLTLTATGEAFVSESSTHDIRISLVLEKRKRRQEFATGDYFAIPLKRKRLGYGRILWDHPSFGPLAELYDVVSAAPVSFARIKSARRLYCTYVPEEALWSGRWRVVGRSPLTLQQTELPILSRLSDTTGDLWQGEKRLRRTTREEAEQYASERLSPASVIEDDLEKTIKRGLTFKS